MAKRNSDVMSQMSERGFSWVIRLFIHICDLTDPPTGFIRGVLGYHIKTLMCNFSGI